MQVSFFISHLIRKTQKNVLRRPSGHFAALLWIGFTGDAAH